MKRFVINLGDSRDTKIGDKTKNERFRNGLRKMKPVCLVVLEHKQQ